MKDKIIVILLWIILTLTMCLASCTETIYDEIIKLDTVFVDRPIRSVAVITDKDTIVIIDTVSVNVIIRDTIINTVHTTDTVFQVIVRDSIIIKEVEKIVTVYDTIIQNHTDTVFVTDTLIVNVYDRTVVYLDTLVTVSYMRPTESIPEDILPHVQEFYQLTHQYGKTAPGGVMIIQYVAELPGENWSSNSFEISDNGQMVIQLDQRYPAALHRASIFREMGRLQLNKKYTNIPDRVMNPTFSPETIVTKSHLDILFK